MMPLRFLRKENDRGATLVIVAGAMMLMLGVAAIAVDLSALRFDLRADRLASDAAATAGVNAIDPLVGSDAADGCEVAWGYALLNLADDESGSAPDCAAVFSGSCDPDVAREAVATAGPYDITITHPVPDGHSLMSGQDLNEETDGVACQRLGVTVERVRDFTFARVFGFDAGTTTVHSVARLNPDVGEGDVVPLVLLEPFDCDVLTADGQARVTVAHFEDSPGIIVIDSDGSGSCGPKSYTMEVKAQGMKRWIRALPVPGTDGARSAILSYALSGQPGAVPSRAYNPDDLTTAIDPSEVEDDGPPESWFQLYPEPQFRSQRVTRAPIDHRYNCKSSYPDYLGIPIAGCIDSGGGTHIDVLTGKYGGNPETQPPQGDFKKWTEEGHSCNFNSGTLEVSGNWWVDCHPRFVVNGATVIFTGGDVVFDGDIDLRSDGVLEINPDASGDRIVFIRDGDMKKGAQSSITLTQTFVYIEDGIIDLRGGTGGLVWTAPIDGDFKALALWSESGAAHEIGGQAGNTLTGTFFTPFANPFALDGQGGQLQTDAQFVTRKLEVKGQGEVFMKPDPETSTLIPVRGVLLIR